MRKKPIAAKRRIAPPIEKVRIHPRPSPPAPRTALAKREEESIVVYTAVAEPQKSSASSSVLMSIENKEVQ
jgi:hypothetical protein